MFPLLPEKSLKLPPEKNDALIFDHGHRHGDCPVLKHGYVLDEERDLP